MNIPGCSNTNLLAAIMSGVPSEGPALQFPDARKLRGRGKDERGTGIGRS